MSRRSLIVLCLALPLLVLSAIWWRSSVFSVPGGASSAAEDVSGLNASDMVGGVLTPPTSAVGGAHRQWVAGRQTVHTIRFVARMRDAGENTSHGAGINHRDDAPLTPILGFESKLELTPETITDEHFRIAARMTAVSGVEGVPALATSDHADLQQTIFFDTDGRGTVTALWIPHGLAHGALAVWREVLGTLQFSWPDGAPGKWRGVEMNPSGELTAEYRADSGQYHKTWLFFTRVGTANGGLALPTNMALTATSSSLLFKFNDDGVLRSLASTNVIDLQTGESGPTYRIHTQARAAWFAQRQVEQAPVFDSRLRRVRPYVVPDESPSDSARAQLPPAQPLHDILASIATADLSDGATQASLISHLERSFADAQNIALAMREMNAKNGPLMIRALARVASPEAQRALADVVASSSSAADLRQAAALATMNVKHPTPELVDRLDRVVHDGSSATARNEASYALGVAAQNLKATDPASSSRIVERMAVDLAAAPDGDHRVRIIDSLGNTRHPDAIPAIKQALDSTDSSVRRSAALALRNMPGAGTDELLASVISNDDDTLVRTTAVTALGDRPVERALPAMERIARDNRDPAIRAAAVDALQAWHGQGHLNATDVLEALTENAADLQVRQRASEALAAP